MTEIPVHTELLHGVTSGSLGGWSLPGGALVAGGVLAAVLSGVALGTRWPALIGEMSIATIIGTSALQPVRVAAAAPAAAPQPSFAFGFLEFDWDPNAPGGVPGFELLAEARPARRRSEPAPLGPFRQCASWESTMDMLLGGLAFGAIMFGQFAAVVAVHRERKIRKVGGRGPAASRLSHKAYLELRELRCRPASPRSRRSCFRFSGAMVRDNT